MHRYLLLALLSSVCTGDLFAQSELTVGDTVSELQFHQLLNYIRPNATLNDFGNKAILIDFWETFCQPCINQFPKLAQWQSDYGRDIQIITITSEQTDKIAAFYDKISHQHFSFITATGAGNSYLNKLFPHHYIPHYIWIGKDRIVKAITGYEAVTEDNITALITNQQLHTTLKKDDASTASNYTLFNPDQGQFARLDFVERLLMADSLPHLQAFSMLSDYNKKYPASMAMTDNGIYKDRRIVITNLPLSTMTRIAYGRLREKAWEFEMISVPRFFTEIKDVEKLRKLTVNFTTKPDTTGDMYCYEAVIPRADKQQLLCQMRTDLYGYFGIKGIIIPRKLLCYTLIMKDSALLLSKGGQPSSEGNLYYIKLTNMPFEQLVYDLRFNNEGSKTRGYEGLQSAIIVDSTHFTSNIDIDLKAKLNDLQALKVALAPYGLDLIAGEQMVDVLVLKDE